MKVSLLIPAYNEEERLGSFLASIVLYKQRHPKDIDEVIVIDDGSTDGTAALVKKHKAHAPYIKLLVQEKNRGKGAAVRTGVFAARGDYIVFMDADGATPITELPKMLAALAKTPIGVGNRWMRGAKTERHSRLRRLSGWIYRTYMRLFKLGNIDTMCGFKGYHARAARTLFGNLQEERWLFDTEIAYKSVRRNIPTTNFPIRWESKDGSKLSTTTLVMTGFRIWPLIRKLHAQ